MLVLLAWAAHGFCRCAACAGTAATNSFHGRDRKWCFCSAVESKPFTAVRVSSSHKLDLCLEMWLCSSVRTESSTSRKILMINHKKVKKHETFVVSAER